MVHIKFYNFRYSLKIITQLLIFFSIIKVFILQYFVITSKTCSRDQHCIVRYVDAITWFLTAIIALLHSGVIKLHTRNAALCVQQLQTRPPRSRRQCYSFITFEINIVFPYVTSPLLSIKTVLVTPWTGNVCCSFIAL